MSEGVIKVLQVVSRNPRGGIYRVVDDLVSELQNDRQIELHVALIDDKNYRGDFVFSNTHVQRIDVVGSVFSKLAALARHSRGVHIIHLHGFSPWQAIAVWLSGSRIVFTNHGLLGTGRGLKAYEYLKRALMKRFLRHKTDRIVNISAYAQRRLVNEYKVPEIKNAIVHNCTRWSPLQPRFSPQGALRIGFHGRFVFFKRIDRLLAVAASVAKELKTVVVLVGDGPLRGSIEKQAKQLGLVVEMTGYQDEVRRYVESFDVEIIASDEEYFGLSVLESIQAGHPVFVFQDGGGCAEIFDRETDWYVCTSPDDMANKILMLQDLSTRIKALKLLSKLQLRAKTLFSPQAFVQGYKSVYNQVLNLPHG